MMASRANCPPPLTPRLPRACPTVCVPYVGGAGGPIDVNIAGGGADALNFNIDSVDIPKMRYLDKCRCDDVNSDGSDIVPYVEVYCQEVNPDGTPNVTLLGTFTDETMTTVYTPVNPIDCDDVGVEAESKQGREVVENGGVWSPTQLTTCYTIRVGTVADPSNPPTYEDSFGNVTTLEAGEVVTYSTKDALMDAAPVVRTNPGDRIVITSVSLGAQ